MVVAANHYVVSSCERIKQTNIIDSASPSKLAPISRHIQFYIDSVNLTSPVNSAAKVPRSYVRVRIANRKDCLKSGLHFIHHTWWKESLAPLALDDSSNVIFELRQHSTWKSGSSQSAETDPYALIKLLEMQWGSSYITVPLKRSKSCPNLDIGTLTLAVRVLSFLEVAQLSLYSAENSVSEFIHNSKKLSSTQAERQRAGYETLKPICAILDIVGPLVMFSPEPICAAVIGIIRSATKSVLEQIEQDADVLALIKQIEHIYFLVAGTAGLKSQRTDIVLKDALRELVIVLEDCTQFLVTFCKSSFLGRLARTPQQARQLKVLQARVANTAAVLNRALLLKTALSTEKVARDLDKYEANMMLERLGNVVMSTDARPRCTDGAHATILASVKAWATAPLQPGKNIFWLRGPESHDKRAVVTTLFEEFLTTRHLGGNFFFEEDRRRNPALVMQTLAWQLTCYHAPLRFDIAHRIKENKSVLEGRLEDQFEELLLQPLLYHSPDRPVVFMLDGLEWCGKERGKGMGKEDFLDGLQWRGIGERKESEDISASVERAMLEKVLRVLVEGSACFPPNARLLISSGEYETVLELLGDCNRVVELEMEGDDTVTEPVVDWRRRSF